MQVSVVAGIMDRSQRHVPITQKVPRVVQKLSRSLRDSEDREARSAGYDCVINATVREGRVWLPKQHHHLESPRSRGVGTPRVCRPADYLPSGTVGQWPPATRQWWNERRGGDPKTDRATQRCGDPKTDQRKEELSKQLGCEGKGPENPGVVAPLVFCKLSRQLPALR